MEYWAKGSPPITMLQNFSLREGPPPYRFKRAKICVFAEKGLKMDLNVPKIILIAKNYGKGGGREYIG